MTTVSTAERQLSLLLSLGAEGAVLEELQRYNRSRFQLEGLPSTLTLPLADEPFVEVWEEYAAEAKQRGVFEVLRERLPQLQFPIRSGISVSPEYAAATRKGKPFENQPEGLRLIAPERLQLLLHATAAGRIPVIIIAERSDFVTLVQALARRNEPEPIPDSLGALMLSGYNNWDRIARLRQCFERGELTVPGAADWSTAFAHVRTHKELYQDRLLLLGLGPYSDVPAAKLALPEDVWERLSLVIRLEHESTHYLTRRLLGSMRNNLLDELIADYAGIVAAAGRFIEHWQLCFMGLEYPDGFRPGGRLYNYRGDPQLSDGAFRILQRLARRASRNLAAADRAFGAEDRSLPGRCRMILALAHLSLDALAYDKAKELIRAQWAAAQVVWTGSEEPDQNGSVVSVVPALEAAL